MPIPSIKMSSRFLNAIQPLIFFAMATIVSGPSFADDQIPPDADKTAQLQQFMESAVERRLFRGAVVVMEGNEVIFEFAAGSANDTLQPIGVDSSFYLASLSKQFTAAAIMLLHQQGKLEYEDPIAKFFPELPDWAANITVRQLLSHTSGLGDFLDSEITPQGMTNAQVMGFITKSEHPKFPPGERYGYSNSGYCLLARIVERITGTSFREFTTNKLFKPLQMTAVFNDESSPSISRRVRGYDRFGKRSDVPHLTNGAGGLFGSARDMARWHKALFTYELLTQETLEDAFQPTRLNDGTEHPYGFGWHIHELPSGKALHHTGSLAGFRHFMYADLQQRNAVILLTSGGDSFPLPLMATGITNILRDRPATVPRPTLTDYLYEYAQERPSDLRQEAERIRMQEPDRFRVSEDALNELGYALLEERRIEAALSAFETVIAFFPESANAYDSYGEALMVAGRWEEAVKNYRRSLELDPENENASEMLERIEKRK